MAERLLIGALKGPHGLQGWVKAKLTMAEPSVLLTAGSVLLEDGRKLAVKDLKAVGQGLIALNLTGITTAHQAAELKGRLYVARENLTVAPDEVLLADLIGHPLHSPEADVLGTILGITELPAGPALEVQPTGSHKKVLIPVDAAFVLLEAATPPTATLTPFGLELLGVIAT